MTAYTDESTFHNRFKRLRAEKSLTLKQVATAVETSIQGVRMWEVDGVPRGLDKQKKLAVLLGTTVEYLFFGDDSVKGDVGQAWLRLNRAIRATTGASLHTISDALTELESARAEYERLVRETNCHESSRSS